MIAKYSFQIEMATKRQNIRTTALNKIQGPHLTHFVDVTEFFK